MTDVVEERGGERVRGPAGRNALPERKIAVDLPQPPEQTLHDMGCPERMCESSVLGPGIREVGHAELPNTAQTLHLASS